jgi:hypothetical protein
MNISIVPPISMAERMRALPARIPIIVPKSMGKLLNF